MEMTHVNDACWERGIDWRFMITCVTIGLVSLVGIRAHKSTEVKVSGLDVDAFAVDDVTMKAVREDSS